MGRMTTATIEGQTYEIPDMWLASFCNMHRCTVADALAWWHEQSMMELQWQHQQEQAA